MKVIKIARQPRIREQTLNAKLAQKTFKRNDKQGLAKHMRENPTATEQLMFDLLKENGIPFKPQVVMLGYIVDCYFKHAKSILEVDGGIHIAQEAYDRQRDQAFRDKGFRVLRIHADRLLKDPLGVLAEVQAYLKHGRAKVRVAVNKRRKGVTRWQDVPKLNKDHLPKII